MSKQIYSDYSKVIKVLESCETYEHITTAEQMFHNFCKKYELKWYDGRSLFVQKWDDLYYKQLYKI